MKKTNPAKRLLLSTERIRVLRADQLVGARGGGSTLVTNTLTDNLTDSDGDGDHGCKASKGTGGAN
jgi:hypothetical protein